MKTISKFFFSVAVTLMASASLSAQIAIELPKNMTVADGCQNAKVTNNNRVLSSKGRKAILMSDLTGMRMANDTAYIIVKEDVLKRIDKDSSNYAAPVAAKKSSVSKKKK